MRETYSTLLQAAIDLCIDSSTVSTSTVSTTPVFLSRNINSTIQFMFSLFKNYKTQPIPRTFNTVIGQKFYHYPPGFLSFESVTISTGNITPPLTVINSQLQWDRLQEINYSGDFPQYVFPRQSDFGIYPTPKAVRAGTIVGNFLPQALSVTDYTSGTVSVTQNAQIVTGVTTSFTSSMIGRWFCQTDANAIPIGNWYRISAYTSATSITLESFFEESTLTGSTFVIAQSPELPEELHEYIPYRAAAAYYRGPRRDASRAQEYMNYFYTGDDGNPNRGGGIKGGVLGVLNEYKNKGRSNNQLTRLHINKNGYIPEAWRTTLTEAP